MSAAALIAPIPSTTAPAIPFAPAGLLPWQVRAIVRSGALATEKNLYLIGRGVCRVPRHEGAPVFVVSSASRPGASHLVWVERGRIHCDCPARIKGRSLTCSHAQFVRKLIVAEHATRASVPPAARAVEPAEPTPPPPPAPVAPEPAPVDPAPRQPCPTCGAPTDADEIEQLGECLNCLQMSADREREDRARAEWEADEAAKFEEEEAQQLPCWCCGAPATAETSHGLYCDACVSKPAAQQRREAGARQRQLAKEETARRVIAREKARTRAGIRSEASPRAGKPMKTAAKTSAKSATPAAKTAASTPPAFDPFDSATAPNFQRNRLGAL